VPLFARIPRRTPLRNFSPGYFFAREGKFSFPARTVGFTALLRRCQAEIPRVRRFGSAGFFARAPNRPSPRFFMDNLRLSIHDAVRQRGAHIFERA
jgi:hypothetical protein